MLGMLALALGAAIVFTSDSGTRYRATLEPVIAVLACAGALGARALSGKTTAGGNPGTRAAPQAVA